VDEYEYDYIVVGESLAGAAAALTLAELGRSVLLTLHLQDSTGIEDSFIIEGTPLNAAAMDSLTFIDLVIARLHAAGVHTRSTAPTCLDFFKRAEIDPSTDELLLIDDLEPSTIRVRAAIVAPSGSETGLPEIEAGERFLGHGISHSAWSDAAFFRNQAVAVVGCGHHALEQAGMAARYAGQVQVLCEGERIDTASPLWSTLAGMPQVSFQTGVELLALLPDEKGWVGKLVIRKGGQDLAIPTSALFVAHDPVANWELWGGEERARTLMDRKKLYPAGLAAGGDDADHAALWESGLQAARQCVEDHG